MKFDETEQIEEKGTVVVDVEALLYRLLERWKLFVCLILLGALLAGVYSYGIAKPEYQSTAKIYIKNRGDSLVNLSDLQIGSYLTLDYQEMFYNWEVQEMVLQNLGLNYSYGELSDMVTLKNPGDTRLLYIVVTSHDPKEAMDIANEYAVVASDYISKMMSVETPSIVSTALLSTAPISPNKTLNLLLGVACGLLLALIIAVVQFVADEKIKAAADLKKLNITTLAIIPTNEASSRR